MDYNQLIASNGTAGSIASWVNDSRIQSTAPEIVLEAQDWIYRRLRHWRMIPPPLVGTMSTASIYQPIPSDMLEPDFFMITGTQRRIIFQKTYEEVISAWCYDGNGNLIPQQPSIYAFDDTNFAFDSIPDQAYPYVLRYFQQPAALSVGSPTNFLTSYCQRLLRLVCIMQACEWVKELGQGQFDRTYYAQMATEELERVQRESDRSKRAETGGWIQGNIPGQLGGPGWWGYPG